MNLIEKQTILLPREGTDLHKFAVVACDQFTSNEEYWDEAKRLADGVPSTLDFIIPEIYLGSEYEESKLESLSSVTEKYLNEILTRKTCGFIAVERKLEDGSVRQGLVAAIDLEEYRFDGGDCKIRPTEQTVPERIPSRCEARRKSALECPHILMLLDDASCSVVENLFDDKGGILYEAELQQGGGSIKGYAITDEATIEKLKKSIDMLYVGDGNHSLAAAKTLYEEVKKELGEAAKDHPSRYCLAEIVNLYSPALPVLPIHRAVFDATEGEVVEAAAELFAEAESLDNVGYLEMSLSHRPNPIKVPYDTNRFPLAVMAADAVITELKKVNPDAKVDYIHGDEELAELVSEGAVGFAMPTPEKSELIPYILKNGVFPKKYFSLGHGNDKRYYMECRGIRGFAD